MNEQGKGNSEQGRGVLLRPPMRLCVGCGEASTPGGEYCEDCLGLMGEFAALDCAAEGAERARLGDSAACRESERELAMLELVAGRSRYTPTPPVTAAVAPEPLFGRVTEPMRGFGRRFWLGMAAIVLLGAWLVRR